MPPLAGGHAYCDQSAAEAAVGDHRAARYEFLDQLRLLNLSIDSLSLHNAIEAEAARLAAI